MGQTKPWTDPSVKVVAELFPKGLIRKWAKETGVVKRDRKIDIAILFWVLILGFGNNFMRNIRGLKRRYEVEADIKLSISSFYDRFTPDMVKFLCKAVQHAIEFQAQLPCNKMGERLKGFKDLVIQDSTIIRLHEVLADLWPAARSRKVAAGVKVSCIVSAVANGMKSVTIAAEKTAEIKTLRIGSWVKDRILLIDLGYFKYGVFDRIAGHGGYFVSRLKSNVNPTIVRVLRGPKHLEGKKLKDVLPHLNGEIIDAVMEAVFKKKVDGKQRMVTTQFRMVGVFNREAGKYHLYITNIPDDMLCAEDIAAVYGARWEIEMVFKELKSHYRMDYIQSRNPHVVEAMIWIAILTLLVSRRIYQLVRSRYPDFAVRYTHLRWAKVFSENADRLMKEVVEYMELRLDMMTLFIIYTYQSRDPNVKRRRLMDNWIE